MLIIKLHAEGTSVSKISELLKINRKTAYKWIERYQDNKTLVDKKRPGQPRCTTKEIDREIMRHKQLNNVTNIKSIKESLQLKCSSKTIYRRLKALSEQDVT